MSTQFEAASTKLDSLFFNALTILIVFLSGHVKKLLEDKMKKRYLDAAGISSLIYASSVVLDGLARTKFPDIRLFAELGMLSESTTLWCLVMVIFDSFRWIFCGIAVVVTVRGLQNC